MQELQNPIQKPVESKQEKPVTQPEALAENAPEPPKNHDFYSQQIANMYKDLELSEEKSADDEAPVEEKRADVATQDQYAYYLPKLLLNIPDFEASIDDDEDVVRVKSIDPKTGIVNGKNEWNAEERDILRVYV